MHFVEQKYKLNEDEKNRKWRDKPCASAHIKRSFFVSVIFSEANFFIIFVLSQCMVY